MAAYIIAISITLLLSYFVEENEINISTSSLTIRRKYRLKTNKQGEFILKILCVLPLFMISAFRYGIGTDYFHTYYDGFLRVNRGNDYDQFEIGYKMLNLLLGKISNNPQVIFFVTAGFFCFFTFYAIYVLSPDILFSVILLIISRNYFISMNIVRQFVAMAIILYAFKYIISEKYFVYICFVLLATSFHYSAIICLLFAVFEKIKLSDKKVFAGIGMIFVIAIVINVLDFNKLVSMMFRFTKYAKHFTNLHLYTSSKFAFLTFVFNFALLLIYCIPIKKNRNIKEYKLYLLVQVCATVVCIFMTIIPLIERIYFYFQFVQIISIPYILNLYNKKNTRIIIKGVLFLFLLAYCVVDIFIRGDHEVVPYISIFSKGV